MSILVWQRQANCRKHTPFLCPRTVSGRRAGKQSITEDTTDDATFSGPGSPEGTHWRGPYRFGVLESCVLAPFRNSNGFRVLSGARYIRRGIIDFGPVLAVVRDRFYRTVGGFSFAHTGVALARSDHGLSRGMFRLFKTLDPEVAGMHELLKQNQPAFLQKHRRLAVLIRDLLTPWFMDYVDEHHYVAEHYNDPHPKRLLRSMAFFELFSQGSQALSPNWIGANLVRWLRAVFAKPKPMEFAKPGKSLRIICDLGTQASLPTLGIAERIKLGMDDRPIDWEGGVLEFVKDPNPERLESVFAKLRNPPGRFYFVYFSDDSCLALRTPNGTKWYNIDISSCDASHTDSLFEFLRLCVPAAGQSSIAVAIEQCRAPLCIKSVEIPKRRVIVQPIGARLYTGSGITTAINNLASVLIAIAITRSPQISTGLNQRAQEVGYQITGGEPLERFEDLQFLKHSPVWDGGRWVPIINVGVFLRASGAVKGDFPGCGDLEGRVRAYQAALTHGIFGHIENPFCDAVKAAPRAPVDAALVELIRKDKPIACPVTQVRYVVSDEDLFRRYDVTAADLADLRLAANTQYGEESNYPIIDRILFKDYGLHTRDTPDPKLYAGEWVSHLLCRSR